MAELLKTEIAKWHTLVDIPSRVCTYRYLFAFSVSTLGWRTYCLKIVKKKKSYSLTKLSLLKICNAFSLNHELKGVHWYLAYNPIYKVFVYDLTHWTLKEFSSTCLFKSPTGTRRKKKSKDFLKFFLKSWCVCSAYVSLCCQGLSEHPSHAHPYIFCPLGQSLPADKMHT